MAVYCLLMLHSFLWAIPCPDNPATDNARVADVSDALSSFSKLYRKPDVQHHIGMYTSHSHTHAGCMSKDDPCQNQLFGLLRDSPGASRQPSAGLDTSASQGTC